MSQPNEVITVRALPCFTSAAATVGIAAAMTLVSGTTAVAPTSDAQACPDAQLVFARGSGQAVEAAEAQRFRDQFTATFADTEVAYIELGYPAVPINKTVTPSFTGAVSAVPATTFADSVAAGVTNLTETADAVLAACPDARLVLGGYSQGAMVITETVTRWTTDNPDLAGAVAVVTSFGDPTLVLPEGAPVTDDTPGACRGETLSPWRAWAPACTTHTGLLSTRTNYVPADFADRTFAWCAPGDVVCGGSSSLLDWDAHRVYATPGGPIDQAAVLAAHRFLEQTTAGDSSRNLLPSASSRLADLTADSGTANGVPNVVPTNPGTATSQPTATRDVIATADTTTGAVRVTWAADTPDAAWAIWVNHHPVGLVLSRADATVTDVPAGAVIAVSQVAKDGTYSTPTQATADQL